MVTGSIPGQGTCQGCGPSPRLGASEKQQIGVSPALPFSLKINNIFKKRNKNEWEGKTPKDLGTEETWTHCLVFSPETGQHLVEINTLWSGQGGLSGPVAVRSGVCANQGSVFIVMTLWSTGTPLGPQEAVPKSY